MVVLVTSVYAFFSYGQWTTMDKSIEEMRQNRELEYRAYVGVKGVVFQQRADNPAWGDVILLSVNTGRTPALEGRVRRVIERRDSPPPDGTVINDPEHVGSKIIYVPSLDFTTTLGMIGTSVADQLVTPKETKPKGSPTPPVASLTPPQSTLFSEGWYAYGIIEYKDIFSKPHATKFCYFNLPSTRDFYPCPTFNEVN